MRRKLPALDLFSGIGGNALALKSIAKTVGYCEIDPRTRELLRDNIARRRLDKAPIHEDVTQLTAETIAAAAAAAGGPLPELICASFPCQDISAAGTRVGIKGARSGLVKEVIRLVDEFDSLRHTVKYVFMENSPQIRLMGLGDIVRDMERRGFVCRWVTVSALHVGARHIRKRWFMLSSRVKDNADIPRVTPYKFDFGKLDTVPRLVPSESRAQRSDSKRRYSMLGNSVVPSAVNHAWTLLRDSGRFDKSRELEQATSKDHLDGYPTLRYDTSRLKDRDEDVMETKVWSTPIHSTVHWSPTKRTDGRFFRMFANTVFYEEQTQADFGFTDRDIGTVRNQYHLNPNFVETLMGYPIDWTAFREDIGQRP